MPAVQLLETRTWGRDASAQTMFVIAGWPDTAEVFESNVVDRFQDRYRIIGVNLPGYSAESRLTVPTFGWSFDAVVDMFQATLQQAMSSGRSGQLPVVVAHDWGCIIVSEFLLRLPRYFARIVLLDVAPQFAGEPGMSLMSLLFGKSLGMPLKAGLCIALYQWYLILAFLLGGWRATRGIGDWMTRSFAAISKVPVYQRNPGEKTEKGLLGVHCRMNYLYLRLWLLILRWQSPASNKFFRPPVVPLLYLYGEKKPFHLHTAHWLDHFRQRRDGSKAVGYPAGHWFYFGRSKAAALHEIESFLQSKGTV